MATDAAACYAPEVLGRLGQLVAVLVQPVGAAALWVSIQLFCAGGAPAALQPQSGQYPAWPASDGWGQSTATARPAPPTYTLTVPNAKYIVDLAWLDDQTLAVSSRVQAVNVWSLLCGWWPEVLCGSIAIFLLVKLIVLVYGGVRHRNLAVGEPHCRRCFYQLSGIGDALRCPECGTQLTKHGIFIAPAARLGRIALTALALIATAIVYFTFDSTVPRHFWWSEYVQWPSTSLVTRVSAWRGWRFDPQPFINVACVDLVDVQAGKTKSRIIGQPLQTRQGEQIDEPYITASEDGSRLFVTGVSRLFEYDARTGALRRAIQLLPAPDDSSRPRGRAMVLDPNTAVVVMRQAMIWIDLKTGRRRLSQPVEVDQQGRPLPAFGITDPSLVMGVTMHGLHAGSALVELQSMSSVATIQKSAQWDEVWNIAASRHTIFTLTRVLPGEYPSAEGAGNALLSVWEPGDHFLRALMRLEAHPLDTMVSSRDGQFLVMREVDDVTIRARAEADRSQGRTSLWLDLPQAVTILDVSQQRVANRLALPQFSLFTGSVHMAFSPGSRHLAVWTSSSESTLISPGSDTVTIYDLQK